MAGAGRVRTERERVVRVGGVLSRPRARARLASPPSLLHTHLPQRGLRAVQLDGGLDHVQHGRKSGYLHHLCGGSGWGEVGEGAAMAAGGAGERKSAREVEVRFFFFLSSLPIARPSLGAPTPPGRAPFFPPAPPLSSTPRLGRPVQRTRTSMTSPTMVGETGQEGWRGGRGKGGRGGEWLQQRASEQRGPRAPGRPPSCFFSCSTARPPPI